MKKHISFLLLILLTGCTKKTTQKIQSNTQNKKISPTHKQNTPTLSSQEIENLVETVYGKNSANFSRGQILEVQNLIKSIIELSNDEQQLVAIKTKLMLQEKIETYSGVQRIVYAYLINYLEDFSQDTHLKKKNFAPKIVKVAKQIINYINLEQETIFINQKAKHIFCIIIKTNKLPDLINFWTTPTGKKIFHNYEHFDPVKIQFMSALEVGRAVRDMSIMMAVSQGASMANAHIMNEGVMLAEKINKGNKTIERSLKIFQKNAQKDQQEKLQSLIAAFSDALKDIQEKNKQATEIVNLELDYLHKNISMSQPQQNYIFNQVQFDQHFSLGTMFTPEGPLWKNPFSVGDWEYEKEDNSFWQYQSSPIFNKITDDEGNPTSSSLQAENNSIFAEYFTKAKSYTISGSISLYRTDFPFFTGIIFNKSRWISGDFESIRKCRMIGLYGESKNNIGIYFAQQYTMSEEQLAAAPDQDVIQTPLQQILNKQVNKKINLPSEILTNLQTKPVTLNFEITNSPSTIDLKLWIGNNPPITVNIDSLDPDIYMYHGIGFISPGAVAQFKITEPHDIVFTPEAISKYKG